MNLRMLLWMRMALHQHVFVVIPALLDARILVLARVQEAVE